MADVEKSVDLLFRSDAGQAAKEVESLAGAIEKVGEGADKITPEQAKPIADIGKAAQEVKEGADEAAQKLPIFADKLEELGRKAGLPKDKIDELVISIGRLSIGQQAALVAGGAAVAAFGLAWVTAGGQVGDFTTAVDNFKGLPVTGKQALDDAREAIDKLSTSFGNTLAAYQSFVIAAGQTDLSRTQIKDAFIGIAGAVIAAGGGLDEAEPKLKKFLDAIRDGKIEPKELKGVIDDIPGSLEVLAGALGVPKEKLEELAKAGKIGKEEITAFIDALAQRAGDYKSLTEISDAFNRLGTALSSLALVLGAETGVSFIQKAVVFLLDTVTFIVKQVEAAALLVGGLLKALSDPLFGGDLFNVPEAVWDEITRYITRVGEAGSAWTLFKRKVEDEPISTQASVREIDNLIDAAENDLPPATQAAVRAIDNAYDSTENWKTAAKDASSEVANLGESSSQAGGKVKEAEQALIAAAREARLAEEAANKYAIEMEKIASNERIKLIEAQVKLDTAKIEASIQYVKAGLESLDTTIKSTSELLGDLFGLFDSKNIDSIERSKIFDQIDLENERRDKALKLQEQYTEAIVENLRAQTLALNRGDALIQVDGAGLQPHLEAFMFEILRTIQTRVNREGLGLLLGV